jgi:hypothetical protein
MHSCVCVCMYMRRCLSPRRPGFNPLPVHVECIMITVWQWDRFVSEYFGFASQYHSNNSGYSLAADTVIK